MRRMFGFMIGIVVGALIGSTVALLLTPETGEKLRSELRARGEQDSAIALPGNAEDVMGMAFESFHYFAGFQVQVPQRFARGGVQADHRPFRRAEEHLSSDRDRLGGGTIGLKLRFEWSSSNASACVLPSAIPTIAAPAPSFPVAGSTKSMYGP